MPRATFQPSYDLIGGTDDAASPPRRQPLRESLRASQAIRPDDNNETLRKDIHKLKYEIDSLRQERELTTLRHDEELRAAQAKAEADYKRAQNSESAQNVAASKHEQLARELIEVREQAEVDREELERKARSLQDETSLLKEQAEEKETEMADQERQYKHDMHELQARCDAAQRELENVREEGSERSRSLQSCQQTLSQKDEELGQLQKEIIELKTQTGDADALAVFKNQLSEQVAHIKDLESLNSKQTIKLKKLEEQHKSVQLVEEEKRQLENRLAVIDQLNRELSEQRFQRQILEDERKTWTSYLENESTSDEDLRFDTPESLAKAFVEVRLEKLSLINELGKVQPEVSAKDEVIQALESQLQELRAESGKLQTSSTATVTPAAPDAKAQARVERQRVLAVKEVEYLRAQLKMFDAEEAEMSSERYNEQHTQKLAELQVIVDEYRNECESLRKDLDKAENGIKPGAEPVTGQKRQRTDDDGEAERNNLKKARKLQEELKKAETSKAVLQKELDAARSQISSLKSSSRTRVLELRNNPTANAVAIKQATLDALRTENEALLVRLEGKDGRESRSTRSSKTTDSVPAATAERLRSDLAAKDKDLASADKKYERLTESFKKRSLEFREAVASILGWKLDIMPNGRVRVRSMFDPVKKGADADEERSIVFDGDKGTMKVSGGPQSEFAKEIRQNIEYWVDGRREVPCFLAATTLDFWERGQGTTQV